MPDADVSARLAFGARACQDVVQHTLNRVHHLLGKRDSPAARDLGFWVGEMLAGFEGSEHNQLIYTALDQSQTLWPFAVETGKTRWHAIGRYTQNRVYMAALTGNPLWISLPTVINGKLQLEKATTEFIMQPGSQPEVRRADTGTQTNRAGTWCPPGGCRPVGVEVNTQTDDWGGICGPGGCEGTDRQKNAWGGLCGPGGCEGMARQVDSTDSQTNAVDTRAAARHVVNAATAMDQAASVDSGTQTNTNQRRLNQPGATNQRLRPGWPMPGPEPRRYLSHGYDRYGAPAYEAKFSR